MKERDLCRLTHAIAGQRRMKAATTALAVAQIATTRTIAHATFGYACP